MDTAVRPCRCAHNPSRLKRPGLLAPSDQPPTLLDWGDFTEGSGYQTPPAPPPHA